MQVIRRCIARPPHQGNHLSLAHGVIFRDKPGLQVGVGRFRTIFMRDDNDVAKGAVRSRKPGCSIPGRDRGVPSGTCISIPLWCRPPPRLAPKGMKIRREGCLTGEGILGKFRRTGFTNDTSSSMFGPPDREAPYVLPFAHLCTPAHHREATIAPRHTRSRHFDTRFSKERLPISGRHLPRETVVTRR